MPAPHAALRGSPGPSGQAGARRAGRGGVLLALALAQLATGLLFLLSRASGTDAALTGLPLDDGWIHLVYARSLAALQGFAYNPGQQETGFTSPLWVFLLAPVFWLKPLLGEHWLLAVKALGLAVAWAASVLAHDLTLRLTGRRAAALVVGLLIALDPSLSFAKVSGMEVVLAGACVLLALDALARRRPLWAGVALALAPLARPENAVFSLAGAGVLAALLIHERARARTWVAACAPALVAGGSWLAFCLATTGRPLPNTFYAKHAAESPGLFVANLETLFGPGLLDLPWFFLGSGVVLFAYGALRLLRDRPGRRLDQRLLRILLVLHPFAFLLALAWAHHIAQPLPFYWNRYFQPVLPVLLVPLGIGIGALATDALGTLRSGRWLDVRALASLLLCALPFGALPGRLEARAQLFSENCQDINEAQVALGRWLESHSEPGEWVATHDAGAIRFFSGRPVVDLAGLNQHDVVAGRLTDVLRETAPRLFVVFPALYPQITENPRFRRLHELRDAHYTICRCPQDVMAVYEWAGPGPPSLAREPRAPDPRAISSRAASAPIPWQNGPSQGDSHPAGPDRTRAEGRSHRGTGSGGEG